MSFFHGKISVFGGSNFAFRMLEYNHSKENGKPYRINLKNTVKSLILIV